MGQGHDVPMISIFSHRKILIPANWSNCNGIFIKKTLKFSCGGTNRGYGRGTGAANTGGGFWTGMGVGGLMGYMFGNRG